MQGYTWEGVARGGWGMVGLQGAQWKPRPDLRGGQWPRNKPLAGRRPWVWDRVVGGPRPFGQRRSCLAAAAAAAAPRPRRPWPPSLHQESQAGNGRSSEHLPGAPGLGLTPPPRQPRMEVLRREEGMEELYK